jgi:enterochelin esterase-like enzyme
VVARTSPAIVGAVTTAHAHRTRREPFAVPSPPLAADVTGEVWACRGLDAATPAPLLVVHDGPAYDAEADLLAYLQAHVDRGALPPLRVALLVAPARDLWFSANPAYAGALAEHVVPHLTGAWPTTRTVGIGASLGALAWLHAQSSYPAVVDGLFLQSGSYFRPETDPQESGFSQFPAIVQFVSSVRRGGRPARPVPTVLTCGAAEENLANNRRMARVLHRLGYRVRFAVVPGGHDYASWRGAFDPHLPDLVRAALRSATDGPA